jgi:hypothetical protein
MAEGRYHDAEDIIAMEVRSLDPYGTTPVAAVWWSRFAGHVHEMVALREVRHRNFARALLTVEKALVPFPDDPPVMYPEPQVWADLSLRRKKYASVDLARRGSAEEKILNALDDDTTLDFIEAPLQQVIAYLADLHGINMEANWRLLDTDEGITTETPVTRNLKGISLRSALRLLLRDLSDTLTYVIRDEVLLITTLDDAESELVTKVYPVGDLVLPIMSGMGGMGGGMMGGMGGGMGMGGMGGGMMGGMGGMGGGMGGMGMGGMGMGGMGGGMFAVQDDLILGPRKKAASPVAIEPQTSVQPSAGHVIRPERQAGQSLEDAWNAYFQALLDASEDEQLAVRASVRTTARHLMNQEQFEEAIAMLRAALGHGFPQPWMYEGLALALQATDAPLEEIERAMMSVVDFATNMDDILVAAEYMTHLGLDRRALELFREVAATQPLRPEPYLRGLAAAQRMDDEHGIMWACKGILRQAWPIDQQSMAEHAFRVARATFEKMKTEGRQEQAERFEKEVAQAMVRDCVIRITWTGEADLDLYVEEPGGTICSAMNPRTPSGGVMLGDNFARPGGASAEGYSEYYVCPEGFSGEYRLVVKRVWGQPSAGKVTVEVATHLGSEREQVIGRQISIGKNDSAVAFELADGRRQEPLNAEQIANVARSQEAIARAIVTQQLASYESSDATLDYRRSVQQAQRDGRLPRRNVGVRPEITQLPEGTQFGSMAVISADRRYVRVTPFPNFTGIGEVTTFTFVGDETGVGGTGGIGGGGIGGGPVAAGSVWRLWWRRLWWWRHGAASGGMGGMGGGFSDARLKNGIESLEYGLETVKQMRPVRFQWTEQLEVPVQRLDGLTLPQVIQPREALGAQDEVGLLAQDVETLVPEIVTEDSTGLKRVDYAKLVPVLIKAVQELSEANEQLRSDVRD